MISETALSVRLTRRQSPFLGMFPAEPPEPSCFSALRLGERQLNFIAEFLK